MNNPNILDADWAPAAPESEYEAKAQQTRRAVRAWRYRMDVARKRRTAIDRLRIGAITLWVVVVTIALLCG